MGGPLAYWINAAKRAAVPVERGLTHDAFIRIPGNAERLGTTLDSALNSPAGLATLRNNAGNLGVSMLSKMSPAELRALAELIPKSEIPKDSLLYGNLPVFRVPRGDMIKEANGGTVKMAGGGALSTLSKHGRGWWLNKTKNIVKEIPSGDLGPHGDHDGWIGLGRNARSVGVDPRDAKAMQRGTYGFYLPEKMSKEWIEQGGSPMMTGKRAYYNAMLGDSFEPAEQLFFDLYGMFPDEAAQGGVLGAGSSLDDLMRARLWPNNTLSVDSASGVDPEHVRKLWDAIGGEVQSPGKVKLNVVNERGGLVNLPLMEALTKKRWAKGGLVRMKEARCG